MSSTNVSRESRALLNYHYARFLTGQSFPKDTSGFYRTCSRVSSKASLTVCDCFPPNSRALLA